MSRGIRHFQSIRQVQRRRGLQYRQFCSTPFAKIRSHLFPESEETSATTATENKTTPQKSNFDQRTLADLLATTKPPTIHYHHWARDVESTERGGFERPDFLAHDERLPQEGVPLPKAGNFDQRLHSGVKRSVLPAEKVWTEKVDLSATRKEALNKGTPHPSYAPRLIISDDGRTKRLIFPSAWSAKDTRGRGKTKILTFPAAREGPVQEVTPHPLSVSGDLAHGLSPRAATQELLAKAPSEIVYDADIIAMRVQGQLSGQRNKRQKKEKKPSKDHALTACGTDDVLALEADELLNRPRLQVSEANQLSAEAFGKSEKHSDEIMLEIEALSATGDGLGRHPTLDHVFVIPFTLAGEIVKAQAFTRLSSKGWDRADLVAITQPSALREGTTPQCKHFGKCSGCQLQMISYTDQLKHKKTIVEHAFQNFSGLKSSQYPTVEDTGASPLQYGYRTKLTPHFETPRKDATSSAKKIPPIGFNRKGFNHVLDIESCPIAAPIIEEGLRIERAKVAVNINKYQRGATLLLRETTERTVKSNNDTDEPTPLPSHSLDPLPTPEDPTPTIYSTSTGPSLTYNHPLSPNTTLTDIKTYTTDDKARTLEQIGAYTFATRAGSFFQNNNSILPTFLSHVRTLLAPNQASPLKYLLDAYCGSGLFALTLSPLFASVLGIEVDAHGVAAARANAASNGIANCGFVAADAAFLFQDVPFPSAQTALVIDPPRKGCSVEFLRQLLMYGPAKVVYVSCTVNSQARDVGWVVRGWVGEGARRWGSGGMRLRVYRGGISFRRRRMSRGCVC